MPWRLVQIDVINGTRAGQTFPKITNGLDSVQVHLCYESPFVVVKPDLLCHTIWKSYALVI